MTRKKLLKTFALSGGVAITLAPMTIAASCGDSSPAQTQSLDESPEIASFLSGIKVNTATSTQKALVWMTLQTAPANVTIAVLALGDYADATEAKNAPVGAWKDAMTGKDVDATKKAFENLPKEVNAADPSKRHLWVYIDVAKGYSLKNHYFDLTATSGIKNIA